MRFLFLVIALAVFVGKSNAITVMAIDLGSEWMKIAIVKPGVPMEIVLNKETKRKTEVAVALKDGERLFGSSAVAQGVRFPKNTYFYLRDLLAKKMDNPLVQQYKKRYPYYDLIEDPNTGYVQFRHDAENNVIYSPEELLAMTLNYSKSLAEDYAQQSVDSAFITVPAYFNQAERLMLLYSAKLAGLPTPQLMDVNTAAALNYGVFRRNDINATSTYIMFYDMGASSTTATIVAYQVMKVNGVADPQLSVKGVGFDRTLGGREMEFRLREHLIKLFDENKKTKSDVRKSPRAMAKLLKESRRLKLVLSANMEHQARVESLIDDEDFKAKVSREDFEGLCEDLWPRVAKPIQEALTSAGLTMDLISKVILVGGGTRVPKVQEILIKETGVQSLGKSLNADEAPALGASYEAAARSKAFRVKTFHVKAGAVFPIDIEFERVTKHDNGSQSVKNIKKTLFQRNNPYPQRKVITFNRFYSDFGFSVNYGDLQFLTEEQMKTFGSKNISRVQLGGVGEAHEKYGDKNDTESKGIKAHFRMDEGGVLYLEEVESVYESTAEQEEKEPEIDPSAFEKLKNSFSSIFGGSDDETEQKKEPETPEKQEEKQETKEDTKEEEKKPEEEKKTEETTESEEQKKATEEGSNEKKTEEQESKEEEKKESEKDAKPDEKAENKTETAEAKKKQKKIKKISAPLTKSESRLDFVEHGQDVFNVSKEKLKVLAEQDALKIAREEAMNALEAYIYDKQDKLYQEDYEKAMTPTEQEEISKALREASDWMFELEEEVAPEVYQEKLQELRTLARPWLLRVKERRDVIPLMKDMESLLNYTSHFIKAVEGLPEDDQIYTQIEIDVLKKTFNDTVNWKNDTVKKQNQLAPSADNVLKPQELKTKIGELNREVQYLLNKARTAKPKKKKEETKTTNSTKTDKEKSVNGSQTIDESGTQSNETKPKDQQGTDGEKVEDKKEEGTDTKEGNTETDSAKDESPKVEEQGTSESSETKDDVSDQKQKDKDESPDVDDTKDEVVDRPTLDETSTDDSKTEDNLNTATPTVQPTQTTGTETTAHAEDEPPKQEL